MLAAYLKGNSGLADRCSLVINTPY